MGNSKLKMTILARILMADLIGFCGSHSTLPVKGKVEDSKSQYPDYQLNKDIQDKWVEFNEY